MCGSKTPLTFCETDILLKHWNFCWLLPVSKILKFPRFFKGFFYEKQLKNILEIENWLFWYTVYNVFTALKPHRNFFTKTFEFWLSLPFLIEQRCCVKYFDRIPLPPILGVIQAVEGKNIPISLFYLEYNFCLKSCFLCGFQKSSSKIIYYFLYMSLKNLW